MFVVFHNKFYDFFSAKCTCHLFTRGTLQIDYQRYLCREFYVIVVCDRRVQSLSSVLAYVSQGTRNMKIGFPRIPFDIHIHQLMIATTSLVEEPRSRLCITSKDCWTSHDVGFNDRCHLWKSVGFLFTWIIIITGTASLIAVDTFICLSLAMSKRERLR